MTLPDKNHEISSVVLVEKSLDCSTQLPYTGGGEPVCLVSIYGVGGTGILPDKDVDK